MPITNGWTRDAPKLKTIWTKLMKTKPIIDPKLIAAFENFNRAKILTFNQAATAMVIACKPACTFQEIYSILGGRDDPKGPTKAGVTARALQKKNLITISMDIRFVETGKGKRAVAFNRCYATPYLKDVLGIINNDLNGLSFIQVNTDNE